MNQTKQHTLLGQCIAEFIGTGLLIFFGVGCVAALVLAGAQFGQWEISIVWGFGVSIAIYCTAGVSGAHINPAVTIALAAFHGFDIKRKCYLTSFHKWLVRFVRRHWSTACTAIFLPITKSPTILYVAAKKP